MAAEPRGARAQHGGAASSAVRASARSNARAIASCERTLLAIGAHLECCEPARDAGPWLRHRQPVRRHPAKRRGCRARDLDRSASRGRKNSRQSGGVLIRIAIFAFALSPALALSYALPKESAVPGGVKIIRLETAGNAMPYVDVDGHRALVVQEGQHWTAVIGIPLSARLGSEEGIVHGGGGGPGRPVAGGPRSGQQGKSRHRTRDEPLERGATAIVANGTTDTGRAQQLIRYAPDFKRPVTQSTWGHGYRCPHRHARQGAACGHRHRNR